MKTTLEISKYPLHESYKVPIKDFIKRLNTYRGVKVKTSETNTLVSGNYEDVMGMLQKEIKISFEKYGKVVFVVKVFHGDLIIK